MKPGSLTAHALEPVLEVINSIMEAVGGLGRWVAELLVGLLWVCFGPGKFDLWCMVYDDVTARPDVQRAQGVDEELCKNKEVSFPSFLIFWAVYLNCCYLIPRYSPKWPCRASLGSKPTSRTRSVLPMKKLMMASATTQLGNPSM